MMADFVNTIDVVGDDELIDSIIERRITEIADNQITALAVNAFPSCRDLKTASFPNTTVLAGFENCEDMLSVYAQKAETIEATCFRNCRALAEITLGNVKTVKGTDAFRACHAMKIFDFPVVESIGATAFRDCTALEAVIIRTPTMCTLANANAFQESAVAAGTGYIYVPAALVDTYKADSVWSTYASQIRAIEDYPEITG